MDEWAVPGPVEAEARVGVVEACGLWVRFVMMGEPFMLWVPEIPAWEGEKPMVPLPGPVADSCKRCGDRVVERK